MTVNEMTDETTTDTVESDATDTEVTEDAVAAVEENAADDTPAPVEENAADDTPAPRKVRKVREGLVVSDKMDKTAVVEVVDRVPHAKYNKFILRTKKLYAHDETNDVNVGDKVRVMETRPLSKSKRWRITEVLERAK